MRPGFITIANSTWFWPALTVLVVEAVLVIWSYRRIQQMSTAHRVAFCLKLLGIGLVVLCLTEPLYNGQRAEKGANLLAVVVDNSATMNVRDRDSDRTRGEMLGHALEGEKARWLDTVSEHFKLRRYTFDSRLNRNTDFSQLTFDGRASATGTALQTLGKRYYNKPLAGIVLMTDGGATDVGEQFYDLSDVPPVYPVLVGQQRLQKDLSITNVSVTQTSFEDAPVTIQADAEALGFKGQSVTVILTDDEGVQADRSEWKVKSDDDKRSFRFRLRPKKVGVLFYDVTIARESVADANDPQSLSEATALNNKRTVVVDRGKGPYRILYVTGRPNWEYKFLKRAVANDQQIELVALIRVARREPKYDWRGRTGERSNPMFRGFEGDQQDQGERYDQPVLVRLNTRDETELAEGFPKTAEKLFCYHAVILDDVDKTFFSQDQMDLLRRFVSERGGGFLMLGGAESFREGKFDQTPIASTLPVYLDRVPDVAVEMPARLELSRAGWLEPWARLRDNEDDERQRLEQMPGFAVLNRTGAIKAGARVVATIVGEREPVPALVVHRYGNGRAGALTIGDIWRWGMLREELHEDMDKFWRQTLRWLVADVPKRVQLQVVHKTELPSQPVELKVRARGEDFELLDNVSVTVEVRDPADETIQLRGEPSLEERGLFEVSYVPRAGGGYFAHAVVKDSEGIEIGTAETGWTADLQAREFASINANKPLLEEIARRTKGRMVALNELDKFASELPYRNAPVTSAWVRPLWDLPGVLPALFFVIVACFASEWLLRRWKQTP